LRGSHRGEGAEIHHFHLDAARGLYDSPGWNGKLTRHFGHHRRERTSSRLSLGRVKVEVMDLGPLTTVASPEIRAWWGAAQTFKKHSRSLSSSLTSFFFGRLNAVKRKRRNRRFRRNFDPNRPTVVAEGDSWVLYPWKLQDVAEHLAKATNLSSVGAAGDELKDIVTEQQHLDAINKLTRDGRPPSALVFSAGGNDILGARFKGFLKRYSDGYDPGQNPERFLDFEAINNAFEHIEDHYSTFFDEMAGAYPEVAIYVHGYDYAEPGGNGEPIQAVPFHQITGSGDWLSEALEGKHIFAEEDQDGIIRVLVNRYNTRLQEIVSKRSPTEPIRYIDARGIVKEDWANEIHPNTEGFRRVAEEFKALLLPTT
ncbi:MAG: hypothetical protein AAFR95_15755, partial [Bacteroidota bacterium]